VLLAAINLEMNAHYENRDHTLFSGYVQTDDIALPVARSLQLIK